MRRGDRAVGQDVDVLTAILVTLAAAVVVAALGLVVAVLLRRARAAQQPPGPRPAIGSPAQVWLERGERVAGRLRKLAAEQPMLAGVDADADDVLTELRAAATEAARLVAARAGLPVNVLAAQDLLAAIESLLARMRAAVAALERAEAEFAGLLAGTAGASATDAGATDPGATDAGPTDAGATDAGATDGGSDAGGRATSAATAELAERVAGLRAGLAEVRALSERVAEEARGQPGEVPGSVEPPRRT